LPTFETETAPEEEDQLLVEGQVDHGKTELFWYYAIMESKRSLIKLSRKF